MPPSSPECLKRIEELVRQHSHRTVDHQTQAVMREMRQRFLDMALFLEARLPLSRERSTAQTKLDEARMWAFNAITLNGQIAEKLDINLPEGA